MAILAANFGLAAAAAQEPRRGLAELDPANDPWLAPAAAQGDPKRGITIDFGDPDRAKLFRMVTDLEFIAERRLAYRDKYPAFVVPGAFDDFNATDADTLGVRWHQRLAADPNGGRSKRAGAMGLRGDAGRFPLRATEPLPEAAVFNEDLGAPDMDAEVTVVLGGPRHEFGLLLRAGPPDLPGLRDRGAVSQWERNSFVYAAISGSRVVVGKRVAPAEAPGAKERKDAKAPASTILASAEVAAKDKFRLRFLAFGKTLEVYRDGELIARAEDPEPRGGHYAGLVGLAADGAATAFDDFRAGAYYGGMPTRAFAAMGIKYRGPNVHHTPLYFEQRMLERHGHHLGNIAAPFVAHGLFVVDFLLAPASVLTSPPTWCTSSDLYARPGELVPYQITPPILDRKARFLNLAALGALGFLVP